MSRRARLCVRCIEAYAEPDSLVCEVCAYEVTRENRNFAPYEPPSNVIPLRVPMPGLARFKAFIASRRVVA